MAFVIGADTLLIKDTGIELSDIFLADCTFLLLTVGVEELEVKL